MKRFTDKTRALPNGCVEWTASGQPSGYGQFFIEGKLDRAHRAAWRIYRGEIPDGYEIDHLCNNRKCVNVDHLEPVTKEENLKRGRERRSSCRKGHPRTDENTRKIIASNGKEYLRCRLCDRMNDANYYARKNQNG